MPLTFFNLFNSIHWINFYPEDNAIGFANAYPLASDLTSGWRNLTFEQVESGRIIEPRIDHDQLFGTKNGGA